MFCGFGWVVWWVVGVDGGGVGVGLWGWGCFRVERVGLV